MLKDLRKDLQAKEQELADLGDEVRTLEKQVAAEEKELSERQAQAQQRKEAIEKCTVDLNDRQSKKSALQNELKEVSVWPSPSIILLPAHSAPFPTRTPTSLTALAGRIQHRCGPGLAL